ncbi:MAG: diguanylate cyclase [Anaerolineae bacterium]
MVWTPFVLPYLAAALALAAIVRYVRRFPGAPAAGPFSLLMLLCALWALSYALDFSTGDLQLKILISNLRYTFTPFISPLILVMALEYTGNRDRLSLLPLMLLLVIPAATALAAITTPYTTLMRYNLQLDLSGAFPVLLWYRGPLFFIQELYGYSLSIIAFIVLIFSSGMRTRPVREIPFIMLGLAIPWLIDLFYTYGLMPLPGINLAPIAFLLPGLLYVQAFLRLGWFSVAPVARSLVMQNLDDPVIVLDRRDHIVDFNPAAATTCALTPLSLGQVPTQLPSPWDNVFQKYAGQAACQEEVIVVVAGVPRYYELRLTPVQDGARRQLGRLFQLRDVTERKQAEERLRQANERLQAQLAEIQSLQEQLREQAIRDPLTGLFNRRYLHEASRSILASAERTGGAVAVVLFDIDHFKQLNDTSGHGAGDTVLQAVGQLVRTLTREMDVACRYGGEEFLVVMPNAEVGTAAERAEALRAACQALHVEYEEHALGFTVSAGVAAFPAHGENLEAVIRAADGALYAAKEGGRNRVCMAGP